MPNAPAASQALAVLKLLGAHAAPMPAAAIGRELGLPRSTVYHLLAALRDAGFVVHLAEQRRYGLGVAAFELGSAYVRQDPLRWVSAAVLAALVDRTGHSGHFAVLHGTDVLYLLEERAPGRASLVTDVGVRLPAHLTASGLAMLAALTPAQLRALLPPTRRLVRRHSAGPATLADLRRVIAEVAERGYAHEDGFVTPGFASVAAPVLDHTGHPVAAIALTYPAQEVGAGERESLAAGVRRAAGDVGRRILGASG